MTTFAGLIAPGVICGFQSEYQNANTGAEAPAGPVTAGVGVGVEFAAEVEGAPIPPQPAAPASMTENSKKLSERE
ncbi:MAG TPA: hypothetical protein VGJ33_18840 [Candidatus Angelobacter sp.]